MHYPTIYLTTTYLFFKQDIYEALCRPCHLSINMYYYIFVIHASVF